MYKRILKNQSGVAKTYVGQTIPSGSVYEIPQNELTAFKQSSSLFNDVIAGDIVINDGSTDITDAHAAWTYLTSEVREVEIMQQTPALGGKVAVHSSAKPTLAGIETFAVWSGAGDDLNDPSIVGGGDLLQFQLTIGTPELIKDVHFNHAEFGRVWIHEAYMKFEDGGIGDYASAYMMSYPTQLQQAVNLDLILENDGTYDWIKFAPGGPGTGTHGFAATPALVPRPFSKDGDWDYDETTGLVPNSSGTGYYKICVQEQPVSKYINKIPCFGTTSTYFTMSSDETAEIRPGYFIRVKCKNASNSNWSLSVVMELYRQATVI